MKLSETDCNPLCVRVYQISANSATAAKSMGASSVIHNYLFHKKRKYKEITKATIVHHR